MNEVWEEDTRDPMNPWHWFITRRLRHRRTRLLLTFWADSRLWKIGPYWVEGTQMKPPLAWAERQIPKIAMQQL